MQKPRTIGLYSGTQKVPQKYNPVMDRLLGSRRWRKASKSFLSANPLCVFCEQHNRLTPAQCVDHIIPWRGDAGLFWAVDNWQSACNRCHGQKGRLELPIPYVPIEGRYVVTGRRGTGKSTWVRQQASPGDIVWDLDTEAQRLGYGEYPRTDHQMARLYAIRDRIIKGLECSTNPCYIIVHDRMRATPVAQRLGARVVVIDCGEDERRRRLMARDGSTGDVEMVGGWQAG